MDFSGEHTGRKQRAEAHLKARRIQRANAHTQLPKSCCWWQPFLSSRLLPVMETVGLILECAAKQLGLKHNDVRQAKGSATKTVTVHYRYLVVVDLPKA